MAEKIKKVYGPIKDPVLAELLKDQTKKKANQKKKTTSKKKK